MARRRRRYEDDEDEEDDYGADDAVNTMIPYKNVPALISYYLGILSLLPFIGILPGIPALILGIMGLMKRARDPRARGSVHAWIGIVLGGGATLLWGGLLLLFVVGSVMSR